jgi:hypothetical protein
MYHGKRNPLDAGDNVECARRPTYSDRQGWPGERVGVVRQRTTFQGDVLSPNRGPPSTRDTRECVVSAVADRAVVGVKQTKQSATARNNLKHSLCPRRIVRLAMSDNHRRDTAPSGLGRCTDCEAVYPVCRSDEGWRAVGTDGTCRCGGDQFTLMKPDEPAARGKSRVSPRA